MPTDKFEYETKSYAVTYSSAVGYISRRETVGEKHDLLKTMSDAFGREIQNFVLKHQRNEKRASLALLVQY